MDKKVIMTSMKFLVDNKKIKNGYRSYLIDTFKLDNEGYIFQGITKAKDNYLITAYKRNTNSIIFVCDEDFIPIKKTRLYNNAHVGGICYDNKDSVYITDKSGTVSIFDLNEILNNDLVFPKKEKIDTSDRLKNIFGQTACAYIASFNNKYFLGNFNTKKESILKICDKDLKEIQVIENFNELVQGVTLNNKYLLVSSSFGSLNKSLIIIYKYDTDFNLTLVDIIKTPPMLEQIYLNENKLICLYEINSYIKKDKYPDILILDLNSILR